MSSSVTVIPPGLLEDEAGVVDDAFPVLLSFSSNPVAEIDEKFVKKCFCKFVFVGIAQFRVVKPRHDWKYHTNKWKNARIEIFSILTS